MKRYLAGETLIEAYWKSVAMPGQGIFIGEPLANPYGAYRLTFDGSDLLIRAGALQPGDYDIVGAAQAVGPYVTVAKGLRVTERATTLRVHNANLPFYQLRSRISVK